VQCALGVHANLADLADTVGFSTVHFNRVLQRLRAKDLIGQSQRTPVIPDVEALDAYSGFDPHSLHLGGRNGVKEGSG